MPLNRLIYEYIFYQKGIFMARPKKEKELRHTHQIMLRLTDMEYEIVSTNARNANLPLAKYTRKQILNKKVIVKYELVADLPELKKLIAENLQSAFSEAQVQTTEIRKALRSTEQKIKEINEQIHYTGQYLANKSVYSQFIESNNKKKFRKEHQSEITLYETARHILKENSGAWKLPSMKVLKAEKERLVTLKTSQYKTNQNLRKHQNELKTVSSNVDVILGKKHPLFLVFPHIFPTALHILITS